MKNLNRALVLSLLIFAALPAWGNDEIRPTWSLSTRELLELEASIQNHRSDLLNALAQAIEVGVDGAGLTRPYQFDSNAKVVDIPRSVLNRVIISSLQLEITTTEKYLFCDTRCDSSLEKDFADHPQSARAVGIIRALWPKIKASFAILWKDIPTAVWLRVVNAAKYSRSIGARARYQANAYGGVSMAAGAAGFAAAFTVTEIAETMFLGPLHFVCKANYFWSVAFATAISSLSRDVRTLLLFEKDGKSFFDRLSQVFGGLRSLWTAQRLEQRVLFRTVVGEQALDSFGKLTRRESHSSVLEPLLAKLSATQAVAADSLLWAELLTPGSTISAAKSQPAQTLFGDELEKIVNGGSEQAKARWQDLAASLRVVLKIFRNALDVEHILYDDRGRDLAHFGALDLQLRSLDLMMQSWLSKSGRRQHGEATLWLRNALSEWLAISIAVSSRESDSEVTKLRIQHLKSLIELSVGRGEIVGVPVNGVRELSRALPRTFSCRALFHIAAPAVAH